ncbi:histidine kinase [Parabacteroides sp. PF5-9]|uniref:sensor histidine kinase n=1 Tax=Parabacteroides sp. PF5-9 TaxID=1742404 RepID=UPI0024743E5F|nr:histidine kinase [Parabacteroides sp. PF5-9]MDH6359081.1 sensor histidine kinase YesM [Parabacteroides sp. PF5-9]
MKFSNKYILSITGISLVVSVLIYFPEWMSLFGRDENISTELFPGIAVIDVINEMLFTFISLIILFGLNIALLGLNRLSTRLSWQKLLFSFVLTWIASNLLGNGFVFLHHQLDIPAIHSTVHFLLHPVRDFIISAVVSSSCYITWLIRKSQQVQIENQQLRMESLLNQYEALKNQLNPHMLFNSLNTLRSLIRETPDKAQDYLQELSRVLRYTLQENENQTVSLREEMEFVNAYLFLLKMRYEDNLMFHLNIDEASELLQLPPMAVQMLIENAVKHNEISNRKPFTITIHADKHQLTVYNPIQPKLTPSRGTGIGLGNLAKRYDLLFKKTIEIQDDNNLFSVTIPLI